MSSAPPLLVTALKDLCIGVVASNFEQRPSLAKLPTKEVQKVVERLPLELPLELAGTLITDDSYWKKRACSRWKNCEISAHGSSWKQLYFERNLQEALEEFDANKASISDLRRLLTYSRRFVQNLAIRQLPSHVDPQLLFDCMSNSPSGFSLTYNLRNVGMEYDRALFGMKLSDCRSLAHALERTETLTYLNLSGNNLDDDKMRMLASGLLDNISITHLDLSHNKIADRGARALAKVLERTSVITLLDLNDNQLHAEGARAMARAIKQNNCLLSLNLRLNRMGDAGSQAVLDAVRENCCLEQLNMSSNTTTSACAPAVVNLLRANLPNLTQVDLSCNDLGQAAGPDIRNAVQDNTALQTLDIRGCNLEADDEVAIQENMLGRLEKK